MFCICFHASPMLTSVQDFVRKLGGQSSGVRLKSEQKSFPAVQASANEVPTRVQVGGIYIVVK